MLDLEHTQFGQLVKEHATGMKYYPPGTVGIRGGLKEDVREMTHSFGTLLTDPTFKTYDEFLQECKKLDSVRVEQAGSFNVAKNEWCATENNFAIVSNLNGKTHSFVKERYKVLQDVELIQPLVNVCEKRKVNTFGRFDGVGSGRTNLTLFMNDPEFVVPLLEGFNDPFMLGLRVVNSYDKLARAQVQVIGVRMVCCNFGVHGDLLGNFYFKHFKSIEEAQEKFEYILDKMVDKSPQLRDLVQKSLSIPVKMSDVPDLLLAVGIPDDVINQIVRAPQVFAPEVDKLGLNAWTLYDMATASYTYMETRSKDMSKFSEEIEKLNDLLVKKHDDLIVKGRKLRDELMEEVAKKEKLKELKQKKLNAIWAE